MFHSYFLPPSSPGNRPLLLIGFGFFDVYFGFAFILFKVVILALLEPVPIYLERELVVLQQIKNLQMSLLKQTDAEISHTRLRLPMRGPMLLSYSKIHIIAVFQDSLMVSVAIKLSEV